MLPILNRLIGPAKVRVSIKTLILLPTRELAQQTLKEVERFSQFTFIKSGLITGGEDFKVQAAMLRKVPDILIGTPGRMIEQLNAGNLDLKEVEVLVLDEADRMLDMGFAEDVQRLVDECTNRQQTMLFSATTGGSGLREMIAKVLNNPEHLQLNAVSQLNSTTRQQIITADHNQHKEQIVNWLLANETYEKGHRVHQHPGHGRPHLRPPGGPGIQGVRTARRERPEGPQAGHRPSQAGRREKSSSPPTSPLAAWTWKAWTWSSTSTCPAAVMSTCIASVVPVVPATTAWRSR
nr:hypothetical protein GCM10020185_11470 [Pseudomonas brassicacearum subsp. brassicacearum]